MKKILQILIVKDFQNKKVQPISRNQINKIIIIKGIKLIHGGEYIYIIKTKTNNKGNTPRWM